MRLSKIAMLAFPLMFLMAITACDDKGKTGNGKGSTASENFKAEPGQSTPLHFAHLVMEFGPVTSGDTVKATYPFKNATNTAVTITGAITSCPCMMSEFPKTAIQPGAVGEIKINFATAGQMGRHEKIIAVTLQGSNEPITLHLNGQIDQLK